MELIRDISEADKYIDEQRPMTVEEWEIAKGMFQRATAILKGIAETSETKKDIINKVQHLNCFSMRNQKDFERFSYHSDYLDLDYREDNTKSVEYICVTIGLGYVSEMFNVAIKHLFYEYEDLKFWDKLTK